MSHANQFRDTPHYVPLTGEIRAGKIQGEARGFPDAQSGTVDWTGNPTTISSPTEMRFDDTKYRLMASPDGVRKSSNYPRYDSGDGVGLITTVRRYNTPLYKNPTNTGFGAPATVGITKSSDDTNMQKGNFSTHSGYSFLDHLYPPHVSYKFGSSGLYRQKFITGDLAFQFSNMYGYPMGQRLDSDCSMHVQAYKLNSQNSTVSPANGGQPTNDWNGFRTTDANNGYGRNMIETIENINDPIPTDSAVSSTFSNLLQIGHDRSKQGLFHTDSASGHDYAEPPKFNNNRGIGEIRFSDFRGKSQIYKSDYEEGDNHGYGQYGYFGYGHGDWQSTNTTNYFAIASNGMFLSGGTNSAGTALNAFGFVHPDFSGKSSPTGITLPNSGGAIDVFPGAGFSQKSANADSDGNLHFHQKHKTQRKTGQGSSSIFFADVANHGRCTHMIWYTDTTFTTGDFAGMNGQIGANASWPGGTYGTGVADYIFEIGFSGRVRNTLFSKITWANGTQANNTSNNTTYYGVQNAEFYPRSNVSEVAYRGAHADNGYFGQTVWRGLYSCGTASTFGGPSDVATESRPLPSNTTSTTATGNVQQMRFHMFGDDGHGWREHE